jgi:hypothetical protein
MRDMGRRSALVLGWLLLALFSSNGEAQQFYTAAGNGYMLRVFGCPPLDTLTINGVGPTQQGECTSYQAAHSISPAVPIETWVTAQVSGAANGLKAQNERLQREVDQLTARVQALEATLNRMKPDATK